MGRKVPYILGIILTGISLWLFLTSNTAVRTFIDRLDNLGYDLQLRTQIFTRPFPRLSPIAIIDIDDASLRTEGHWPWSRAKLAKLVEQLKLLGVRSISLDIFFAEPQPNVVDVFLKKIAPTKLLDTTCEINVKKTETLFNEDITLAQSLSTLPTFVGNVFLPDKHTQNNLPPSLITLTQAEQEQLTLHSSEGYISNIPIIQMAVKGEGFINVDPDADGIARRALLIMNYHGQVYPALSVQTFLYLIGGQAKLVAPSYDKKIKLEGLQLGKYFIPTDESGQVLIPFVGKRGTFPTYSASDVFHNLIPENALRGKIILIGTSALGLGDLHATAIQTAYPGVEVQATLLNGLLLKNFSYLPAWTKGANFSFIIIFGLIGTFLFPRFGPRILTLTIILFPIFLLTINNLIWTSTGFIFSSFLPVILLILLAFINIIYGYLFETRKREQLKNIFGQYVPEKHIDEMLNSKDVFSLHGEDKEMTVLFADIRNFTSMSENLKASDLVKVLNDFFTPMTEIVFKHRGTIDKYIGDMLMAFWGAPLKDKNHARHALESALEMQKHLVTMKSYWDEHKLPEIKIGIGINSGIMSVGDMGSRFRRNYTVLGDEVNLASRIETLTKLYGVDIIVSDHTRQKQAKFIFKLIDKVRVKGKKISTDIYELVCLKTEISEELSNEIEAFEKALNFYFRQQWNDALLIMTELHNAYPKKKLYDLYIRRIKEYQDNPPAADWDGVHTHSSK